MYLQQPGPGQTEDTGQEFLLCLPHEWWGLKYLTHFLLPFHEAGSGAARVKLALLWDAGITGGMLTFCATEARTDPYMFLLCFCWLHVAYFTSTSNRFRRLMPWMLWGSLHIAIATQRSSSYVICHCRFHSCIVEDVCSFPNAQAES